MGNPLKKTMVFLGLAEEDLEEHHTLAQEARPETESVAKPAAATQNRAHVTPLRKVTPVRATPSSAMNEILTMHPTEYSDATVIAQSFRDGVPVILNLSRMNEGEAKRLIDFASGLVMGLNGRIERVTSKVFLLSPEHVAVSGDSSNRAGEAETFFVGATA